jgi:transposase
MASQTAPVFIGIDICQARLDICTEEGSGTQAIENTRTAIRGWLARLPPGEICIACEATGRYHQTLVDEVQRAGHTVYLIDGYRLSRYRDSLGVRAKTDASDARLLRRYLRSEHEQLRAYTPAPAEVVRIRQLLRRRAVLVRVRVTLQQSMADLALIRSGVRRVLEQIDRIEAAIQKQIVKLIELSGWAEDYRRCLALEGVGPLTSAALSNTFHHGRFASADAFIAYLGLDIRVRESGTSRGRGKLTKKGDPETRRLLHNAAMSAARSSTWKPFYQAHLARGFTKTQALVILARKLARVAFSIMKNGSTYQPQPPSNACSQT